MAGHLKQLFEDKKLTRPKYEALEAAARVADLLPLYPCEVIYVPQYQTTQTR